MRPEWYRLLKTRVNLQKPDNMADSKFRNDVLAAHNAYRQLHQAGPLRMSDDLNKFAQKWADKLAATDTFAHSDCVLNGTRLGENIALKYDSKTSDFPGQVFVDQWYSEIQRYNFGAHSGPSTGHFTQVVWKGSTEFGVGRAVTKKGKNIVVGSYRPAGNIVGKNAENVFPTRDGKFKIPEPEKPSVASAGRAGSPRGLGAPSSGGKLRTPSPGSMGTTANHTPPPGIPAGYKSVMKETTRKTAPDGKVETLVKEIYTYPDGSKRTVERREVKTGGAPPATGVTNMSDRMKAMQLNNNAQRPDSGAGKTSSGGSSSGGSSSSGFIDDAVAAHNRYRKKHSAPPLRHNKELSKIAQKWADHLMSSGKFEHSKNEYKGQKLGENIATKSSSGQCDYTGQECVDQWYSEEKVHDYGAASSSRSGHFTQVVWKGSEEIGLGKATRGGKSIVVANYHPAGNFMGRFAQNVSRPQ